MEQRDSVSPNPGAARLRRRLAEQRPVVAPGVFDAVSARIAVSCGASSVYVTGAGVAAVAGFPDYGLLTQSEMLGALSVVTRSITEPIIADADTGFGGDLNAVRTVHEYERLGIAALHIEDQVFPKRCGHLDGKEVTTRDEFFDKVALVARARRTELVLISRTDSLATDGFGEAVDRVCGALEHGADIAFVDALQTRQQIEELPRLIPGPCMINLTPGGKTPMLPIPHLADLGYAIIILPGLLMYPAVASYESALRSLNATGEHPPLAADQSVVGFFAKLGASDWDEYRIGGQR